MHFWFFCSYARADRDSYLEQFFENLRDEVRSIVGGPAENVCFIDTHNIEPADRWEQDLEAGLRTSRLCIAFVRRATSIAAIAARNTKSFSSAEMRGCWQTQVRLLA
jgi:hypothetical protein